MFGRLSRLAVLATTVVAAPLLGVLVERHEQLLESYTYIVVGGGTSVSLLPNPLNYSHIILNA